MNTVLYLIVRSTRRFKRHFFPAFSALFFVQPWILSATSCGKETRAPAGKETRHSGR